MPETTDMGIIDGLRKSGFKVTPQRLAICRLVLANRKHPRASTIYDGVKRLHPTVSLATVYKTIHVLQEIGLVQELCTPRVQARFDPRMEPHINLICLGCGAIEDLKDGLLQKNAAELAIGSGLLATVQRIDVHGLCQKCKRTQRTR